MTKRANNPFAVDTKSTKALNTFIDRSLSKMLDKEATSRRITKRSIVESALAAYFDPNKQDERDSIIARRLMNLDRRFESIERENKILAEAFAVFVQAWLTHNPEIPVEQRPSATANALTRYSKFVERIAKNFESHETLYDKLPQAVIVTAKDFPTSLQD